MRQRVGRWLTPVHLFRLRLMRGMTVGVRVAAFDAVGRVFLVKHTYTPGWYLPGGAVDP
ncbi:MAG: DNA mismatch repair protein MutT, partial [Hyphomicrobiales bacterium]